MSALSSAGSMLIGRLTSSISSRELHGGSGLSGASGQNNYKAMNDLIAEEPEGWCVPDYPYCSYGSSRHTNDPLSNEVELELEPEDATVFTVDTSFDYALSILESGRISR